MKEFIAHYHESDVARLVKSLALTPSTTWSCGTGTEIRPTVEMLYAVTHGNPYKCSNAVICGQIGHSFQDTVVPSNLIMSLVEASPEGVTTHIDVYGNFDSNKGITTRVTFAHVNIDVTHGALRFEFVLTVRLARAVDVDYIKYPQHIEKRLSDCRQCWCGNRANCACCGNACDCRSDNPALNNTIKPLTVEQAIAFMLRQEIPNAE